MNRRDILAGGAVTFATIVVDPVSTSAQTKEKPMVFGVSARSGPKGVTLYVPDREGPSPAILLLHGSEGAWSGWASVQALTFAMHGFVAMAFPYGKSGNPWHASDIHDIELEKTIEAMDALRAHPAIKVRKLGLYGASRGAEHALLLASLMARDGVAGLPEAVAAHSPSDTIVAAFIAATAKPKDREVWDPSKRAWKWRGSSDDLKPTTPIEIERYAGPVYISHGENDDVWSVECTRRLEARLKSAGRTPQIHYYPNETHGFKPETRNIQNKRLVSFFRQALDA